MDATELKKSLRREFAARRRALTPGFRSSADPAVVARIEALPEYRRAECVASFVSFGAEPDLATLSGKRFFLPRFDQSKNRYSMVEIHDRTRDLVEGRYGILEPGPHLPEAAEDELSRMFYLVPAVGCDRAGHRLGRGGGFYDRLLGSTDRSAAVIYSCCLADFILPSEAWDRPVSWVITENETIETNAGISRQSERKK